MIRKLASRSPNRDDAGVALVLVLVIAVLLIAIVGVVVSTVTSSLASAGFFRATSQSQMAAETGLATVLTSLRNDVAAGSDSSFPCSGAGSLGVPGASSTYAVQMAYSYSPQGATLSCPLSDPATSETIYVSMTSTGKAPHGSTAVMKQDLRIGVQVTTSPRLPAADGYAIFTYQQLALAGDVQLTVGTNPPDIFAGGTLTCGTGDASAGSVITLSPADLTGSCTFAGNVIDSQGLAVGAGTQIDGYVESFGGNDATSPCPSVNTGTKKNPVYVYYGLCTSGGVVIKKDFIEAGGNVYLDNGTIGGSVYASGSIYSTGNPTVTGSENPGDTTHPDTTPPDPTEPPFPATPVQQIAASPYAADWTTVTVPSAQCSSYFANNGYTGAGTPDGFQAALQSQTVATIYNATACGPITFDKNADNFFLNNLPNPSAGPNPADAVLEVQQLTMGKGVRNYCEEATAYSGGTPTCSSATSPGPAFIIQADNGATACTTSTTDVSFSAADNFYPDMAVLVYSYGIVSYANDSGMTGQIQACGGENGTNTFDLSFNPEASEAVAGSGGGTTLTYGTPQVVDKYLVSG